MTFELHIHMVYIFIDQLTVVYLRLCQHKIKCKYIEYFFINEKITNCLKKK